MNSRDSKETSLGQYLLQFRQFWLPVTFIFLGTLTLAVLSTLLLEPTYRAEGKIRFKVDRTPVLEGVEQDVSTLKPLVSTQNPLNTEIEVIYAKPLLKRVISTLKLLDEGGKELGAKDLHDQLSVAIIGGTDVISIAHEGKSAEESALIVNTLMKAYLQNSLQRHRAEANEARNFIANQLPISEKTVRETETAISRFKEVNNVVDLDSESGAAVTEVARLDREINMARVELDEAASRAAILKAQVGLSARDAATVSNLSQSSEIKEVLKELQAVERQLASARELYQEEYPDVVSLKSKRDAFRSLLSQSQQGLQNRSDIPTVQVEVGDPQQSSVNDFLAAEVNRRALASRLESLIQRRTYHSQRIQILPKLRQELRELERKLKAAQSTYEFLLTKKQELQIAENSNAQNAEIIEPALIPTSGTVLKKKAMIVAFGALLGAFLASASIPILSWRRQRLAELPQRDIESDLGYPIWATVDGMDDHVYHSDRDPDAFMPVMNEMHRMLQVRSHEFFDAELSSQALMVTSPSVHESRSRIAANLSSAMAQTGKKVLLIDADLDQPSQHKIFELPGQLGLCDVLDDTQIRFDEVKMIINPVMKNLDVLTSGTPSNQTPHQFNAMSLEILLRYCTLNYDVVIIDAPPLSSPGLAVLAQFVKKALLVVSPSNVNAQTTATAKEFIAETSLNILGLVVNGIQTPTEITARKAPQSFHYLKS